jgi:hypothetical protein
MVKGDDVASQFLLKSLDLCTLFSSSTENFGVSMVPSPLTLKKPHIYIVAWFHETIEGLLPRVVAFVRFALG